MSEPGAIATGPLIKVSVPGGITTGPLSGNIPSLGALTRVSRSDVAEPGARYQYRER